MKVGQIFSRKRTLAPNRRPDQGTVLVLAMLMLVALMAMSVVATRRTISSSDQVRHDYQEEKVFQVADGGLNVAERWLRDQLLVNPDISQAQLDGVPAPPPVPNYNFLECSITRDARIDDVRIADGPFQGLLADVQPFTLRSRAENANSSSEKQVECRLNEYWINLFQYAIYYDGDLEISMRNPSTFVGRIHSNGNVYLTAQANFDIFGSVTAAGHIYDTPKDPNTPYVAAKCRIADRENHLHYLSYDWRDPDWVTNSLSDWDGLVQDSSHGVTSLPAPIVSLPNPIDLIKRGQPGDDSQHRALRFWYRAGRRIVDGEMYDSLDTDLGPVPASCWYSRSVWDWREGHNMQMQTFYMDSLMTYGIIPANGILYISSSQPDAAVRIAHALQLPAGGLVVASDNPVYVLGNYNTVYKQPSSIFCDAFNLYSNGWDDTRDHNNLNQRNAIPTQINSCIVAGDVPTVSGHYSGGASNLIRLHEKWSASSELTYRGSLVCVFPSEQATGYFVNGAPVFSEHHRNSGYDPTLLDPNYWPDDALAQTNMARADWRVE